MNSKNSFYNTPSEHQQKHMGVSYCMNYQQQYLVQDKNQQERVVSNAPNIKYALRMKNLFPPLPDHIQNIRSKNQIMQLNEIIKDSPIYFIYEKSAVYQGHWKNGLPHGCGKILYKDFSYYQGLVFQGQPSTCIKKNHHEDGLFIFADGSYYVGEFQNANFQGKGKLFTKNNQMKIFGSFHNGLPHGWAIQSFIQANQVYDGQFQNGLKSGRGKYYVADKLVYQGQFKNGNMHGKGRMIDYNGSQFVGNFDNGKKTTGEIRSIMGNFRGDFNAPTEGQGLYEWNDGKFYIGSFKNNMLHGKGTIYHLNGRVIQGEWLKGHSKVVNKVYTIKQSQVLKLKQEYKKSQILLNYQEVNVDMNSEKRPKRNRLTEILNQNQNQTDSDQAITKKQLQAV